MIIPGGADTFLWAYTGTMIIPARALSLRGYSTRTATS